MCLDCGDRLNLARQLAVLGARQVLIVAALDGLVAAMACAMDECVCPEGRTYFPLTGPWRVSADRYPKPGRDGGEYVPDNVRLAHYRCNSAEVYFRPGHQMSPEHRQLQREATSRANRGRAGHRLGVDAANRWAKDPANAEAVREMRLRQGRTLAATWARKRGQ